MATKDVVDSAKKIKDGLLRTKVLGYIQAILWLAVVVGVLAKWGNGSKNDQIDYLKLQLDKKTKECETKDSIHRVEIAGKDLELKTEREGKERQNRFFDSVQESRLKQYDNDKNKRK